MRWCDVLATVGGRRVQLALLWALGCCSAGSPSTDCKGTCDVGKTLQDILRPPPLLVGISGGSGCGKTRLANELAARIGQDAYTLSTDNYYRTLSEQDHFKALEGGINFDTPEALDLAQMAVDLMRVKEDLEWPLLLPSYNFSSHHQTLGKVPLPRPRALLVEGLFVLQSQELRELMDVRLFVQDDLDRCLSRRLRRDTVERGIPLAASLIQYEQYVRPAYTEFIAPSAVHADLLIPSRLNGERALELVSGWVANRTLVLSGRAESQ